MDVSAIKADFVARVSGVDLGAPVADTDISRLIDAIDAAGVLVFPGQSLTGDQQIALSRRFGPLETSITAKRKRRLGPEFSDISNLDAEGRQLAPDDYERSVNRANELWHTDSSFKAAPAKYSLLYAEDVPAAGGETEFADARAGWDALPETLRMKIEGRIAWHSLFKSRERVGYDGFTEHERREFPPVPQVMARVHHTTGRRSIYVASHIERIEGLDDDAAQMLVAELIAFATQPRFVYRHQWSPGDLVMWDNRCVLHRGLPWDRAERRVLRRTTVAGDVPTIEEQAIHLEGGTAG